MQEEYKKELQNYQALWQLFARNSLTPDFRKSLYSSLALVFVPSFVNIYYIFRQSVLKNTFKFGSIITTLMLFHYNLNKDFEQFVKKDTIDSNLARVYIQNISQTSLVFPYFQQETLEVVKTREKQPQEISKK